ncbi:MAG: hypothetical protein IK035_05855 [Firmicutes bacterium]|nr:hypothetical protein [Bacillota bacterium]
MKDVSNLNQTKGEILKHSLIAAAGLFCCGIGIYLTIQANIGVSPWDVFHQGIAGRTGMLYGNVSVIVALIVVVVDIFLKEPIGIGMFLDAFIVGKAVDLCARIGFLPVQTSLPASILWLLIGQTITACGIRIYMGCGLGCGPRDTLLVALCKRTGWKIGPVTIVLYAVVTLAGWLLGGQVGIGTVLSVLYVGPALQTVCRLTHFDAAKIVHQDLRGSWRVLTGKDESIQ